MRSAIFTQVIAPVATVLAIEIFADPLKLAVPLKSPESPIFLAVCNVVAVLAFHVILPTIFDENVFTPENVCAPAKNATLLLNLASANVPAFILLAFI